MFGNVDLYKTVVSFEITSLN